MSISRFTLLTKTGFPCTALAFNLCRKNEALVASGDCSLRCYDSGDKYEQNGFQNILLLSVSFISTYVYVKVKMAYF